MEIIFLLIGISLVLAIFFLVAFIRAVRSGQYEDDYTPSIRILLEDTPTQDKNLNDNPTKL
jgi:cbb3-type cytochrome oxidase maturation protein